MEILKYTLPALIVLATAYLLLKKFLDAQQQKEWLKYQQQIADKKLPLKLQAYERLMLFCERIDLRNLVFRIRTAEMDVATLSAALLITVQKEYEHNMAQQIYTSDNLWKIIETAKDQTMHTITQFGGKFQANTPSDEFSNVLMAAAQTDDNPLNTARKAIKEEVKLYLN